MEFDLTYKNKKEILKTSFLGFLIGIAIIVPGISGSTISILFKLYNKILYSISNIIKKFKECFLFLFPIVIGIIIGFSLGLFTIKQIINILPFSITSLFAGLMIGSLPIISKEIKQVKKSKIKILLFIIGLLVPITISIISTNLLYTNKNIDNLEVYQYFLFIIIGYLLAITQIVPGLSATALLMALGYFQAILNSFSIEYILDNPKILFMYLSIGIGFIIGLITCSKMLTNIFIKYKKEAYFFIVGLSISSIISMFYNPDIYNVYLSWINGNKIMIYDLSLGIILFIIGILSSKKFS